VGSQPRGGHDPCPRLRPEFVEGHHDPSAAASRSKHPDDSAGPERLRTRLGVRHGGGHSPDGTQSRVRRPSAPRKTPLF
jgi:hypothetical protein